MLKIENPWKRKALVITSLAVLALLMLFAMLGAAAAQGFENPFEGDPAAISEGGLLFGRKCIFCHGTDGAKGPNLFDDKWMWGGSNKAVYMIITVGRQFTPMGGFYSVLTGDQIWKIITYIRAQSLPIQKE